MSLIEREGASTVSLGIDVGGTFTDAVLWDPSTGRLIAGKVASTPGRFSQGVVRAAKEVLEAAGVSAESVSYLVHGSTVAANVIAEKKGARVGLLTTQGFRDVLEIQRTRRDSLYNLFYVKPQPLVPRDLRLEIPERVDASGTILRPLDEEATREAVQELRDAGCTSIAVVFLFSFLNPTHERRVSELISEEFPDAYVSLSCEVNPEFREYERCSTTVIDAYVKPEVTAYYEELEATLRSEEHFRGRLDVIQSGGGAMTIRAAANRPSFTIESGPAAGAIAAAHLTSSMGIPQAIAFDMGGTTAKATLIEGRPRTKNVLTIERLPVRAPVVDLVEISGGGGSLAWVDDAGLLRLGPGSAGADPGPACYGRGGTQVTVSDANAVLGYYPRDLLGGKMRLDREAAERVIGALGARLEMTAVDTALGILRIANSAMEGAIRLVTTERGVDPRKCALVAFGGAGPVHAGFLAERLGIRDVIIPPAPGNVNAFGALVADTKYDFSSMFKALLPEASIEAIHGAFAELEVEAISSIDGLATARSDVAIERYLDMRYVGQGSELTVQAPELSELGSSWRDELADRFHQLHRTVNKHDSPNSVIELVNLRVSIVQQSALTTMAVRDPEGSGGDAANSDASSETTAVFPKGGAMKTVVRQRKSIRVGEVITGPAIIAEYSSTTVVPPGASVAVDGAGSLLMRMRVDDE